MTKGLRVWAISLLCLCFVGKLDSGEDQLIRDKDGLIKESALRARTRASVLFAQQLVGIDSPQFLEAFMRSYNSAVELEWANSGAKGAPVGLWNLDSILLKQESYREALKRIVIENGLTSEELIAPEIEECVALFKGVKVCCSGILVSERAILTAAHCLPDCGDSAILLDAGGMPKQAFLDRNLDATFPGFDVAIMKLKEDSGFTAADLADDADMASLGDILAVGFGGTGASCGDAVGIRRKALLPIAAATCDQAAMQKFDCQKGEFVAGSGQVGVCPLDSGGGAFLNNAQGRRLAGLTVQQVPGQPYIGRFVRMDKDLRDWIGTNR